MSRGFFASAVLFGIAVLPERVVNSMVLPADMDPRQVRVPHLATVVASRTSEVYVPRGAVAPGRLITLPGLAVA